MRVFVAGGTGTLGQPTVRLLCAAGHEVRALARTPERGAALRALGAEPVVADMFDLRAMTAALAGSEAIMHLATRIPPLAQMRKLCRVARQRPPAEPGVEHPRDRRARGPGPHLRPGVDHLLYQGRGDEQLFETAPIDAPQPLASARDAERETARFTARGGRGWCCASAPSTRPRRRRRSRPSSSRAAGSFRSSAPATTTCRRSTSTMPPPRRWRHSRPRPASTTSSTTSRCPMREYVAALTDAFGLRPARHLPTLARAPAHGVGIRRHHQVAARQQHDVQGGHQLDPRYPSVRQGWREVAAVLRSEKSA